MSTGSIAQRAEHAREFWTQRIWETHLHDLPKGKARRYRLARLAYCAFCGLFWNGELSRQAAALTYYTVLSLVPLLAFAFSVLKGFGAYEAFVKNTIRPYVVDTFGGNPQLTRALEQVLGFVDKTGVTSLGVAGLLILIYTATRLLNNVEGALNAIWNVPSGRSPLRQLTDYVAIIVVTPLMLMLAATLGTAVQTIGIVRSLGHTLGLGGSLDALLGTFGPLVVILIGLTFLYMVMPNTEVSAKSAVIGALIGGVLWYGALVLHVRFQMGVASYNALYSGFAALPIFLVWVQISWLTVMVGAQVAATHQHERLYAQKRRAAELSPPEREAIGLAAAVCVARAFDRGERPPTTDALGDQLDAPPMLLVELLKRLCAAGLLAETVAAREHRWLLARPAEKITAKDVLDALRGRDLAKTRDQPALPHAVGAVLTQLDHEEAASEGNRTLSELVDAERPSREPDGATAGDGGRRAGATVRH